MGGGGKEKEEENEMEEERGRRPELHDLLHTSTLSSEHSYTSLSINLSL